MTTHAREDASQGPLIKALRTEQVPRRLIERLGPADRLRLAAEIALAYARVKVIVRRCEIREALDLLRAVQAPREDRYVDPTLAHLQAARLGWGVRRTLRWMPGDSRCLVQSLVLTRLLSVRGIQSELKIGVNTDGDFAAHAWVEHLGRPLLPASEEEFDHLTTL